MKKSWINPASGINPGCILDESGMSDESGIYPGFITDISQIYDID
jgi:hypothetical protein